ncbi:MAG: hypothetical protein EOP10_10840 [Proteobacteria bacterium]|nr:MAG: hypothetical protein EOP10_10840 [Pseudomonadota bacterium]
MQDELMVKSLTILAVLIPLVGIHGCSAGPGDLKGGLKSRDSEVVDEKNETVTKKKPTTITKPKPTDGSADSEVDPILNEKLPAVGETNLDPNMPAKPEAPSEVIIPPTIVTGTFLTCAITNTDKGRSEVTSGCQLRDKKTTKVIDPSIDYDNITWTAAVPSGVQVTDIRDLLARKNFWHASFHFKMNTDNLSSLSPQIIYKLDAVRRSDGALLKLEQKITNIDRQNFYLRNLFIHGSEAPRCLDFSFDQAADHKGTAGGCRSSPGQRMNFNVDGTIGLHFPDNTQCMTYDPGTAFNYVEPRGCFEGGLPRPITEWEITGQELKWRGSNLCLSRSGTQTDPGNDYIGMVTCNGSLDQRWEIVPF